MVLYYLRLRRESPQEGEYNPLQKMAYTGVFLVLTPAIVLTGMAMSPQLDVAFNWLPAMFGGRQSARSFHFILTFLFAFFTFGHIFMVATTGVFNNMRSMITGWYTEKGSTVQGLECSRNEDKPFNPETLQTSMDSSEAERTEVLVETAATETQTETDSEPKDKDKTLNPGTLERSEDRFEEKKEETPDEKK